MALAVAAILLSAVNLIGFMNYGSEMKSLKPESRFLEDKQAEIERELKENNDLYEKSNYKKLLADAAEINNLIRTRVFSWTELLNALEKAIPRNVIVASLSPRFEGSDVLIAVSIETDNYEALLQFMKNLDKLERFKDIRPLTEMQEIRKGKKLIKADFSLKYLRSTSGSEG
jgi:Tfp pilus assembly protein PilN